jgi:two-component system chemotaxis sensor kinase CheA
MSEQDAMELIFLPGFSTAKQVTSISGRGVGMDVVRTNISKIRGKVTISSQAGLGTTLKIRIPLTLAIIPALIVTAGGDRYAIPQTSVLELVRLEGGALPTGIQISHAAAVYRLRGESVPLVRLDAVFDARNRPEAPPIVAHGDAATIAILHVDGRKFGLIVDDVDATQEIVVKPLRNVLKKLSMFSGATIMGDGRAILILDVPGFAAHAGVLSDLPPGEALPDRTVAVDVAEEKHSLLVFAGDDEAQMAVAVQNVVRVERFARPAVKRSEGRDVIPYMGDMMPLVRLSDLLPEHEGERRCDPGAPRLDDRIHVIVCSNGRRRVGLVVNRILDTIEHPLSGLQPATRRGMLGLTVIEGCVTEILDVDEICARVTNCPVPIVPPAEAKV